MRICIFSHTFPRFKGDNAAPFMSNLAEALSQEGHSITVLLPFDPKFESNDDRSYRVQYYRYIYPERFHVLGYSRTLRGDRGLKLEAYFLSPFLFLFGFLALFRLIKQTKIDIVSAHWIIPNGFIAALVSKLTGVPFIVTIPGSDVYLGGKNKLFRMMVNFAALTAKVVLADNNVYIKQLKKLGIHPKKTLVVPYGVNPEKFKPTKKNKKILYQLGIGGQDKIVLAVGRLVPKKGFIYLIKAMPDVFKKAVNVKLILVGDGDQKKELVECVKKLNIEKKVIFAGTIVYDKLTNYYNIADIFVMPSIKDESGNIDASPVAMMEAISCGVPVVVTKFSASNDFIEEGKTGYLVKEKNSREIARAIIALFNNSNKPDLKKIVRQKALENFSLESVAKKYTNILRLATFKK